MFVDIVNKPFRAGKHIWRNHDFRPSELYYPGMGKKIIIYAEEDNSNQGYFHLLTGITNGSTVLTADVPNNIHVKDFKVLDDWVFCHS